MAEEKNFAEGFVFKRNEKAPEFVVGKLSVKVDEAITWLKNNTKNGWVNIDVKKSQKGNFYMELDTWENPNANNTTAKEAVAKKAEVLSDSENDDDLPF